MSQKKYALVGALSAAVIGAGIFAYTAVPNDDVFETYEEQISAELPRANLSEQMEKDVAMLMNVLGEVDALEAQMAEMNEKFQVSQNENEGLFTVEQERAIAQAYGRYLTLRRALFHIAFRYKDYAEIEDQGRQDEAFLLAYASGLSLYRNAAIFVSRFKDQPNARRKLNEADPVLGIPANTLDELYTNITSPKNVALALDGVAEFEARRARLEGSKLLEVAGAQQLLERLDRYEDELAGAYERLAEGKRDILWTRVAHRIEKPAYQTQSLVSMMVSHIRTPLHGKGLEPESIHEDLRPKLEPGDILLTRRDGYLSNTFLPGFWGHAAMYLGTRAQIEALGEDPELAKALEAYQGVDKDGLPYEAIEAIGEGVRFSSLAFALHANTVAILRPKVEPEVVRTAIRRAIELEGTPYDFSFDVGSQDKIICTELVYRAYAPHLETTLEEVMGRKTLKPDGMLRSLDPGAEDARAELVAYGVSSDGAFEPLGAEALMKTVEE